MSPLLHESGGPGLHQLHIALGSTGGDSKEGLAGVKQGGGEGSEDDEDWDEEEHGVEAGDRPGAVMATEATRDGGGPGGQAWRS
jgi:hypothetical protein